MSRGYGSAQRYVLQYLVREVLQGNRAWIRVDGIAWDRAGGRAPTKAELESVKIAVRGLVNAGVVEQTSDASVQPVSEHPVMSIDKRARMRRSVARIRMDD